MKKYFLAISVFTFFIVFLSEVASAIDFQTVLKEEEYYQTLQKLFSEAETSIDIVIDTIQIVPFDTKSPINNLIETLIEAKKRGVRVRVILVDARSPKNFIAYRNLLENGIDVYFDTSKLLINTKAIAIDSHTCVVGGTNWSPDSWGKNSTLSVMLDSRDMAKTIEDSISKLMLAEQPPFMIEKPEGVLIPYDFLLLKNFGKRFINERSDKAFDLYLALIKEAQERSSNEFIFDYEKCGKLLGLEKKFFRKFKNEKERKEYYHGRIRKLLKVLEGRYNLVNYDKTSKKIILLKQFGIDLSKPDKNNPCLTLPSKFWDAGLPHRFPLNAKYLYLVSLLEVKKSAKAPYWFSNEYILSNLYELDIPTISSGLGKLEEQNLIETARAPNIQGISKKEAKNVYRINQIITEEEFNKKIEELQSKYGQDIAEQATEQAAKLNESKDLFVIETFIHLIQKYGYPAVRRANIDTLRYERGSSLRHIYTTINRLEKE